MAQLVNKETNLSAKAKEFWRIDINNNAFRVLIYILAASCIAATWLFIKLPKPIGVYAQNYRSALENLDSKALFSLSSDEEKKALGLTEQQLDSFVKSYLAPRFAATQKVDSPGLQITQKNMADSSIDRRVGNRYVNLMAVVYARPGGASASVVEDLALMGLVLDSAHANPNGSGTPQFQEIEATLSKSFTDLRSTSLKGYYEAASKQFISWDVLEARLRQLAKQQREKKQSLP